MKRSTVFLQIMTRGQELSRTVVRGQTKYMPITTASADVTSIARRNLERTSKYVIKNANALPLDLATATKLNKMLTRGIVSNTVRGDPRHYERDPGPLYSWLTTHARQELRDNPIGLAERLHFEISKKDAFPDGNGRTARLMADLVLLKAGMAPVHYSNMEEYFARGNARAKVDRATQIRYFQDAVAKGQRVLAGNVAGVRRPTSP